MAREKARRPRWWLIGISVSVGGFLIALADNPAWLGVEQWSSAELSTLVNIGTVFAFAAIPVLLEPWFTMTVRAAAGRAAERAVEDSPRLAGLQAQVEALTRETAGRVDERGQRTVHAVAAAGESPSFETVTKALEAVNELGALAGGIATVQGGIDRQGTDYPLSMRVRFMWGTVPSAERPSLVVQAVGDRDWDLHDGPRNNNDQLYAETVWHPGEPAPDVGDRLIAELQKKGVYRGDDTLEWGRAVGELIRTLSVAVSSRLGAQGTWRLVAPPFELVGNDWAITAAGIEYRNKYGITFFSDDFPSFYPGGSDYEKIIEGRFHPMVSPGDPTPDWRLWDRAKAYLPLRDSPNTPSGWHPVSM